MSDDLVRRLRCPPFGTETSERNLMEKAATRIAELEAALQRIIKNEDRFRMTCAAVIARAALEGGK